MDIKDFYTIKEYAEIKGCSSQYVYRIAHTKLKPFIIEVEGKMCIKREALEEDSNQSTNKETNQPTEVGSGKVKASSFTYEEEMRRINKRNEEIIDQLRADIKDRDARIKEQTEQIISLSSQITELFRNNQQLQLNYQLLLSDNKDANYEEVNVEGASAEEIIETDRKRKGFFSRFFK